MADIQPQFEQSDLLLDCLRHENQYVRAGAALALGKTGEVTLIDDLIEVLEDDLPWVQTCAARGLAAMGVPGASALLAVIQSPSSVTIAEIAGDGLGYVRDPRASDILQAALEYPEEPAQVGASRALAALLSHPDASDSLPAMVHALRSSPFPSVRAQLTRNLGQIGDPRAIQPLTVLLNAENAELRATAATSLGQIPHTEVIRPLFLAARDADESVREAAVQALSTVTLAEAYPILITALDDSNPQMRKAVLHALAHHADPAYRAKLRTVALEDDDLDVRLTAAVTLAKHGDPQGESIISRTLNAPNINTQQLAALRLGQAGRPEALSYLFNNLREPVPPSVGSVAEMAASLASIGTPALSPLIYALGDRNPQISASAAQALGQIGTPAARAIADVFPKVRRIRVKQRLLTILTEVADYETLERVADVLRVPLKPPYLLRFIITLLVDPTKELRLLAANALARFDGPERVSPLLASAKYDPDPEVQTQSQRALSEIGDGNAVISLAGYSLFDVGTRALASVLIFLVMGLGVGFLAQSLQAGRWGLLYALSVGLAFGLGDAFLADQRTIRGFVAGAMFAVGAGIVVLFARAVPSIPVDTLLMHVVVRALFLGVWGLAAGALAYSVGLDLLVGLLVALLLAFVAMFQVAPWWVHVGAGLLPSVGVLWGWRTKSTPRTLFGIFGGVILGFLTGLVLLISGTIGA